MRSAFTPGNCAITHIHRVPVHVEAKIDPLIESQFAAGRLYAAISSRPGQSGRADGYILEGRELEVRAERWTLLVHGSIC